MNDDDKIPKLKEAFDPEEITPVYTVGTLRAELLDFPDDLPVVVAVVKYPGEFGVRPDWQGNACWHNGDDVETCALEVGELHQIEGLLYLTVELEEFDAERHQLT